MMNHNIAGFAKLSCNSDLILYYFHVATSLCIAIVTILGLLTFTYYSSDYIRKEIHFIRMVVLLVIMSVAQGY